MTYGCCGKSSARILTRTAQGGVRSLTLYTAPVVRPSRSALSGNGRSGCWRCSGSKIPPTSENQARKSSTQRKKCCSKRSPTSYEVFRRQRRPSSRRMLQKRLRRCGE
ncbi:unnamed protein product [Ixodes pacificus]